MEPCAEHPERPSRALCAGCMRPSCAGCLDGSGKRELCGRCLGRRRRQRAARWRAAVVGAVVALSALGVVGWGAGSYLERHAEEPLRAHQDTLAQSPCARDAILGLLEQQLKLGNPRAAVDAADGFEKRCGPFPKLARFTYGAHMQLHEHPRAVAAASVLITDRPDDKDYRWWRGQAYEEGGELDKAAVDYQYAISIQPRLQRVPMNLATVYEKLGRPCDALYTLEQYGQRYPAIRQDDAVRQRMARLEEQGHCGQLAGAGRALIRFTPGASAIGVTARLNGRLPVRFVADTGATMVAISRRLAGELGITPRGTDTVLVGTAGGIRTAQLCVLDRVEVQGAVATHVGAAIIEEMPPGTDGLLGLSFLSRFQVMLDDAKGTLELTSRPGAPPSIAAAKPVARPIGSRFKRLRHRKPRPAAVHPR